MIFDIDQAYQSDKDIKLLLELIDKELDNIKSGDELIVKSSDNISIDQITPIKFELRILKQKPKKLQQKEEE